MSEDTPQQDPIEGRVKWFDPGKGFGFVVADSGGPDILLHANVLRNFGQGSVADDSRVLIRVQHTPRGRQATEVLSITPPAPTDDGEGFAEAALPFEHDLEAGPLVPARVKWFDKAKGFGFANVFGDGADVFIHIEVLRRAGLADLQPGEAVALRVAEGRRGKLATEVTTWEAGVQPRS
ncbi:cold-shock DNA-binding protein family [Tranquillimonas rosea]|uniref:Cold-shock DNA-binding protein family n=1 Tax=Tranquillimonas rosea TaxID=641238 RepID=A0A1H9V8A1_9RHOB|nr:cold shock domain-containing protein [Tranquillimonas rosea]SES17761.1 cold-shock DNA-binding protein family [Tranquillimonas rosea]